MGIKRQKYTSEKLAKKVDLDARNGHRQTTICQSEDLETLNGKGSEKPTLMTYTKPTFIEEWKSARNSCRQWENLFKLLIEHTRLTHEHQMSINAQQPTCRNAACRRRTQSLTIDN